MTRLWPESTYFHEIVSILQWLRVRVFEKRSLRLIEIISGSVKVSLKKPKRFVILKSGGTTLIWTT